MSNVENKKIDQARNRFYPGWWTYNPQETRPAFQPFFTVVCSSGEDCNLARLSKPPFIRAEIVHRDVLKSTQAQPDEVDSLLTRLKDAGLSDPTSPYAEEGRRQMRAALGLLKQIRDQKIEADVEEDIREIIEATKAAGFTIRDDPEALDPLRQGLREQLYRRLP